MILVELTSLQKKRYASRFDEVKSIVDNLDKKELNWICNGEFKNSPYVIYREIEYVKGYPAGFIDVYSLGGDEAMIVLAVLPKYRKSGIASKLVTDMERRFNAHSIKWLIWKADADNVKSQKLATELEYKLYKHSKTEKMYRKRNPSYKED